MSKPLVNEFTAAAVKGGLSILASITPERLPLD